MLEFNSSITIPADENTKNKAQQIYSALGIDMATAINVFLQQSINFGGFPFDVRIEEPNNITYNAMENAENDEDLYGPFNNVSDLMEALNA